MVSFINYSRNLKFEEKPDYKYLKNLIQLMMNKNEIIADNEYDWNIKPTKENVRLTFNLILNLIF